MNFGQAIELVKDDKLVSRIGWNNKGMFIFMRPSDELSIDFISKVKSLPETVKEYLTKDSISDAKITFTAYLCMKTANDTIINGWLASQTDMLAEDWVVL